MNEDWGWSKYAVDDGQNSSLIPHCFWLPMDGRPCLQEAGSSYELMVGLALDGDISRACGTSAAAGPLVKPG